MSVEHRTADGSGRKPVWLVRWRDPEGRSRSKSVKTLMEARSLAAKVKTSLDAGSYRDDRRSTITFEEYAAGWLESSPGGASYRASRESLLANHVYPKVGDLRLVDLTQADVRQVVGGMRLRSGKPVARSTAQSTAQLISVILRAAEDEGLIEAAPLPRRWPLPEQKPDRRAFLEVGEAEALIQAIDPYWRPLVMFLADTGCRWGEAVGLTIDKVDIERGIVVISAALAEVRGRFSLKTPKSGRSRVVLLPARTTVALQTYLDEFGTGQFSDAVSGQVVTGLVFHGRLGAPPQRSQFRRRVWNPAVAKAGLEDRHPVPHSLRHTHASHLIAGGVDAVSVASRLGHSRTSVTTDIYGHLLAGGDRAAVAALEALRVATAKSAKSARPHNAAPKARRRGTTPVEGSDGA